MSLYPLSNTWDTKYVTVSNTWARKDPVTPYLTKYALCIGTPAPRGKRHEAIARVAQEVGSQAQAPL